MVLYIVCISLFKLYTEWNIQTLDPYLLYYGNFKLSTRIRIIKFEQSMAAQHEFVMTVPPAGQWGFRGSALLPPGGMLRNV